MTLAAALAAVRRPARGVLLAVGADKVLLPAGAPVPPDDAGPETVAAFGEQAQTFGPVLAVAPAARAVLNEAPAPPDVGTDLGPSTAFKMLCAGLDDAQWSALTSERGLGLADLMTEAQAALFRALFRRGRLWVASQDPALADLPDDRRTDAGDVSDRIGGVRVRWGRPRTSTCTIARARPCTSPSAARTP